MRGTCQNHVGNTLADAMSGDSGSTSSLPLVVLHDWLICTCRYLVALLWGSQAGLGDLKASFGAGGSAILSSSYSPCSSACSKALMLAFSDRERILGRIHKVGPS